MDVSLANRDIEGIVGRKIKMVTYKELAKYNKIDDLLSRNGEVVILYQTHDNYGHWTCLYRRKNNNIVFFDSYGNEPDEALPYMMEYFRRHGKYLFPHLTSLLINSNRIIEYNDKKLQGPKSSTCGRYVALRLILKDMSVDEFNSLFTKNMNLNDKLITYITENLI